MWSKEYVKSVISDILTDSVGANNFKFLSDVSYGNAVNIHGNDGQSRIGIGEQMMADVQGLNPGEMMVSGKRLANMLISTFHEVEHADQNMKLYQNSVDDENVRLMCFDAIGCADMPRYYQDYVVNADGSTFFGFDENYRLMFHEIDAEMAGVVGAYQYLTENMHIDSKDAETYVVDAVHERIKDSSNHYWIEPLHYTSLQEIVDSFDISFSEAKEKHRKMNRPMIESDHSFNIGNAFSNGAKSFTKEVTKAFHETCFKKAILQDLDVGNMVANELNGEKQSEMIACIILKYKPSIKKEYPILKNYKFDEVALFGRELNIKPSYHERLANYLKNDGDTPKKDLEYAYGEN